MGRGLGSFARASCAVRDARCAVRDAGCVMRGARCEMVRPFRRSLVCQRLRAPKDLHRVGGVSLGIHERAGGASPRAAPRCSLLRGRRRVESCFGSTRSSSSWLRCSADGARECAGGRGGLRPRRGVGLRDAERRDTRDAESRDRRAGAADSLSRGRWSAANVAGHRDLSALARATRSSPLLREVVHDLGAHQDVQPRDFEHDA